MVGWTEGEIDITDKYSERIWQQAAPLRRAIMDLPFNRELTSGTLARDTFQFYMLQDSLYLEGYSRALSLASAKAPETDIMLEFSSAAQEALVVERALHEGFFQAFGLSAGEVAAAEPSPTCLAYVNFLLSTAHNASYEEAVAAILPCFWVYWEVGVHIHERANKDNPYMAWIDTYSGDEFADGVKRAIDIMDRIAEEASDHRQLTMNSAFIRSTQYEWMFWDSAYRQENWPV